MYSHHAIVVNINHVDSTSNMVSVSLVEFDNCGLTALKAAVTSGLKAVLHRNDKVINLNKDSVYLVKYQRRKYGNTEAAERAVRAFRGTGEDESPNPFDDRIRRYHLCSNNCEHFVTWCIMDKNDSQQVTELYECFKILISILLLQSIFDGVVRYWSTDVFFGINFIPPLLYMAPTLCKLCKLKKLFAALKLCRECYRFGILELLVRAMLFVIFATVDGLTVKMLTLPTAIEIVLSVAISLFGVVLLIFSSEMIRCCFRWRRIGNRYTSINDDTSTFQTI